MYIYMYVFFHTLVEQLSRWASVGAVAMPTATEERVGAASGCNVTWGRHADSNVTGEWIRNRRKQSKMHRNKEKKENWVNCSWGTSCTKGGGYREYWISVCWIQRADCKLQQVGSCSLSGAKWIVWTIKNVSYPSDLCDAIHTIFVALHQAKTCETLYSVPTTYNLLTLSFSPWEWAAGK